MEEEFAPAPRFMILPAGRVVRGDVDVDEPRFSLLKEDKAFLKADLPSADGLDLSAH